MFPVDPGADATIGGMAATRASGTTAVRYGTMRDNVLGAHRRAGRWPGRPHRHARAKSSAGYDLTRLFVGSEGTLGVITELTLRLHPVPEAVAAAVCAFDTMAGAVETVIATIQLGLRVARIELLDERQLDAINRYSKTSYPIAPTLFFEFHGDSDRHVTEQAEAAQGLAAERGGRGFQWATRLEDRSGSGRRGTTRCTPRSRCVPDRARGRRTSACRSRVSPSASSPPSRSCEARRFLSCLVGHAGDGNFHLLYVLDPSSGAELDEAKRLNERLVARALAMDGTCTGEHGIGYGKRASLVAEHGAGVEVMRLSNTRWIRTTG